MDETFELDNTFRSFRRFLHKIKTAEPSEKASLLTESIELINDLDLFKNALTLTIYCFMDEHVDVKLSTEFQEKIKSMKPATTSSLTIENVVTESDSNSIPYILSKCTEVDAKFLKRIYSGKVEKKNLCSLPDFLKELGVYKKWKRDIGPDLNKKRVDAFVSEMVKERAKFMEKCVMESKRCKKFATTHLNDSCEEWLVVVKSDINDASLGLIKKLSQDGANFTNEFGDEVTHVIFDKDVDLAGYDEFGLSQECEFIFL
jgi:hypothetical protein